MLRSKAEFRAVRERCGITVAKLAKRVGVTERAVMLWESPDSRRVPSDYAWAILDRALEYQRNIIDMALRETEGSDARCVVLPYWKDDPMANANAIATQIALEQRGVATIWEMQP